MNEFTSSLRRAACVAALMSACAAVQAADLGLTPDAVFAPANTLFSLDVTGSGFVGGIVGGGFNLSYDPTRLQFNSLVLDTATWPDTIRSAGLHDSASGTVSDVYFNNVSSTLPTGSFQVARLNFTSLSDLPSTVTLSPTVVYAWSNALAEEVAVNYGSASINAVPEPGTWGLMAAGLAAVALRRRPRRGA
jgi:PEP-CTERM motif